MAANARRRLVVAGVIAAGLLWQGARVGTASVDVADVADVGSGVCTIAGGAAWNHDVSVLPDSYIYSFPLTWRCSGVGDETGTFTLNFIGPSTEDCAGGSGTAPQSTGSMEGGSGVSSATVTMSQSGPGFTFDGTVTSTDGETHHVHANLTVAQQTGTTCWLGDHEYAASGNGSLSDG